jgi:Trypsin-co-occurring domain 1
MEDGTKVLIEADESIGRANKAAIRGGDVIIPVDQRLENALSAAKRTAAAIWHELTKLDADEVEVTYGIKTTGEAGLFAVCKRGTEANYTIKMKWDKKTNTSRGGENANSK